jgi:hypothetical protein
VLHLLAKKAGSPAGRAGGSLLCLCAYQLRSHLPVLPPWHPSSSHAPSIHTQITLNCNANTHTPPPSPNHSVHSAPGCVCSSP